ncbi:hypothetical protein GALMADRAFT_147016 [Galerina marginata CBS 339.88]|uniref:DUF6532 domain-containing protein n=1 Tax=Galerina marginata (strain CBS 339.88) TaxID=685588 RepID=A0A067SL55_GALM3|nr:hypothetical protein GALMADRAFT_147016 [Galerina marginata CBS 339.88]
MARLTPTPADPSYNTAGFPRAREFRLPPLPYEDAPDVNAMVLYANPRAVYERDNDNSQHGDGRAATRWNEWDYEEQDKGGGEYPQVLPGWQEGGDNKLKSSSQVLLLPDSTALDLTPSSQAMGQRTNVRCLPFLLHADNDEFYYNPLHQAFNPCPAFSQPSEFTLSEAAQDNSYMQPTSNLDADADADHAKVIALAKELFWLHCLTNGPLVFIKSDARNSAMCFSLAENSYFQAGFLLNLPVELPPAEKNGILLGIIHVFNEEQKKDKALAQPIVDRLCGLVPDTSAKADPNSTTPTNLTESEIITRVEELTNNFAFARGNEFLPNRRGKFNAVIVREILIVCGFGRTNSVGRKYPARLGPRFDKWAIAYSVMMIHYDLDRWRTGIYRPKHRLNPKVYGPLSERIVALIDEVLHDNYDGPVLSATYGNWYQYAINSLRAKGVAI